MNPRDPMVCIVTGGGSGIGRAAATALAEQGHSVVIAGRRLDALRETVERSPAQRVLAVQADVSDEESVRQLFARVTERHGRLDVLFNNAGVNTAPTAIHEMSKDQWQTVVDINLTGMFLCVREAFRFMMNQTPQGGRIINNGSISAHVPRPLGVAYNATKHAVTGLTRSTSLEGRPFHIACGQIDIGNAVTELSAKVQNEGALQPNGSRMVEPSMDVEIVGRAVVQMSELPLDANVQFMTLMATNMPYIGRG